MKSFRSDLNSRSKSLESGMINRKTIICSGRKLAFERIISAQIKKVARGTHSSRTNGRLYPVKVLLCLAALSMPFWCPPPQHLLSWQIIRLRPNHSSKKRIRQCIVLILLMGATASWLYLKSVLIFTLFGTDASRILLDRQVVPIFWIMARINKRFG